MFSCFVYICIDIKIIDVVFVLHRILSNTQTLNESFLMFKLFYTILILSPRFKALSHRYISYLVLKPII